MFFIASYLYNTAMMMSEPTSSSSVLPATTSEITRSSSKSILSSTTFEATSSRSVLPETTSEVTRTSATTSATTAATSELTDSSLSATESSVATSKTSSKIDLPVPDISTDVSVYVPIDVQRLTLEQDDKVDETWVIRRKISEGGFGAIYEVETIDVSYTFLRNDF